MNNQLIKCRNESCNKELSVALNDLSSAPIVFCGQECVNSFLESEIIRMESRQENPTEIGKLVQNVIGYTQQIQNELDNFKKIRATYFELFKGRELKSETYLRKWKFESEDK
jgi:hypothetical protein